MRRRTLERKGSGTARSAHLLDKSARALNLREDGAEVVAPCVQLGNLVVCLRKHDHAASPQSAVRVRVGR